MFRFREYDSRAMRPLAPIVLVIIAIGLLISDTSWAGPRVALVIGNGTYQHVAALPNPSNDASDVAASLERIGFLVTKLTDATFGNLHERFLKFRQEARGADLAIVYYAGHGIEVGGENWLIPVDAELKSDEDIDKEAISLRSVMAAISDSHFGLIILDACRDNPFAAKMRRKNSNRSVDRGLTRAEPRNNILVAYAARDGTTAKDGSGRNSPFSKALLKHLTTPGLEIDLLFRSIRDDVMAETNHEQVPFVYGFLSREPVYLVPPAPSQMGESTPPARNSASRNLVTDCDRLAASPFDDEKPQNVVGVRMSKIDILHALVACENAMRIYPDVSRFYFEKGRIAQAAKNYSLALEMYQRASAMGNRSAMSNLGALYLEGLGVEKDLLQARAWVEKAVDLGETSAMVILGEMHRQGNGVPTDYAKARDLFETAASQGNCEAMNNLGVMYENGNGITKDFAAARQLFEKSAAQDNEFAMLNLGEMFERGYGVPINRDKARKWYEESADAGNKEAKKRLKGLD
jgi:tetratricopeptide (TPR) repeat protein